MFELTTIRFDIETACSEAPDMLLQEIKTGNKSQQDGVCPTEIILRVSCGRNASSAFDLGMNIGPAAVLQTVGG